MASVDNMKALLFDFDGTLWDSEVARLTAWQELYADWDQEVPLDLFAARIGTLGGPDLLKELERLTGRPIDRERLMERRRARVEELLQGLQPRPGIPEYLTQARRRGIAAAIVSSDDHAYITWGLELLGLQDGWTFICCAEGDPARAKPSPLLYQEALGRLGIAPSEAVAIEDSPNGIRAAKAAEIYCLAVPNAVTERFDLSEANLIVPSLDDLPFEELLRRTSAL
jgi:HAD superfamily hydrolase (TIGR01509 family)